MKRIEILQEICNRDTNKSLEDSQLGLMWVADAIEAMKRYGEFCYNAGMLEKETEKEWEGEIESCLTHWGNKYLIRRKEKNK